MRLLPLGLVCAGRRATRRRAPPSRAPPETPLRRASPRGAFQARRPAARPPAGSLLGRPARRRARRGGLAIRRVARRLACSTRASAAHGTHHDISEGLFAEPHLQPLKCVLSVFINYLPFRMKAMTPAQASAVTS